MHCQIIYRIHYIKLIIVVIQLQLNILQSVTIMKKIFATFLIFFIFFLMLVFPSITKDAAHRGLNLWIFTVMPALLPYTIISSILLYINAFSLPCRLISRILHISLPDSHIFTCVCGLLCGCPIGAKVAADNYSNGKLSKSSAEFLMCAFNCISPSFLINYVFVEVYSPYIDLNPTDKWLLFGILIISSILGATICFILPESLEKRTKIKLCNPSNTEHKQTLSTLIDNCILSAFEIQVKIGGYIILFTIITELLLHTLNLTDLAACILGSTLEITSGLGTFSTHNIDLPATSNLVPCLITSLTAFGGICTIFQTKTVISGTDLSISKYVLAKIVAAIISFILVYAII